LIRVQTGSRRMKAIVYLCEDHANRAAGPERTPMTDDVLICQVPICFKMASWKYFVEIAEKPQGSEPRVDVGSQKAAISQY